VHVLQHLAWLSMCGSVHMKMLCNPAGTQLHCICHVVLRRLYNTHCIATADLRLLASGVTAAPEYFTAAAAEEGASAGSGSGSTSGPSASGGGDRCFLPFSQGPRDCVGQSLAMLELRVALATLLGRFT
jgi:hypothetical protein